MNVLVRDIVEQPAVASNAALWSDLQIVRDIEAGLIIVSRPPLVTMAMVVDQLRTLVHDIRHGAEGHCKFLVFDLGNDESHAEPLPPGTLDDMLADVSDLIVAVPVVTVAWARDRVAGPDLELAFACSVIAGEPRARFHFDLDLVSSLRTYSALARKVGFVRAERMMESGTALDCAQMNDRMLLSAVPLSEGIAGIQAFARARARRHNAACGIYRAQRLAMMPR